MTRKFLHIWWICSFLFAAQFAFSQIAPNIRATVDRAKILIGEPIKLTIEANLLPGSDLNWPNLDSIPHFEFIEKGKIDSTINADGKSFVQHLTITSFDSGRQVIPTLSFLVDNKKIFTDSIAIEVDFTELDPKQDYHDIKDIIDVQNPLVKYVIWMIIALTLVSAALFVYFIRKREILKADKEEQQQPISKLSPYEQAMKALEELKKQNLPESGNTKLFYIRLNDILRLFVMQKLQISSMEKTNEELILQLKQLNMSREQFSQLAEALRMSDFVKFAKYVPGQHDNEWNFSTIESSVKLLNQIEK